MLSSRIAHLEQKLDALAEFVGTDPRAVERGDKLPLISAPIPLSPVFADSENLSVPALSLSSASEASGLVRSTPRSIALSHDLQAAEEDGALLRTFRSLIASYFPFVIILDGTGAEELRYENPLLWKSITLLTTTSWTVRKKTELGRSIMKEIVTRLLLEGRKTSACFNVCCSSRPGQSILSRPFSSQMFGAGA